MAHPTVVINVVGLTSALLGESTPHLSSFARGGQLRRLRPVLPAVTCSVQSSMLTGCCPRDHGIVGNGWYDREQCETRFWRQSNHLVQGEKVWDTARKRDPSVTCANMFWWYNMYSSAHISVTPRPIYKADGRKIPDVYSEPSDLRFVLQDQLGQFPLFKFWGPMASIESSRWIADAGRIVSDTHDPTLMLIYLPHLDYALQRLGPDHPGIGRELHQIDEVVGELFAHFHARGTRIMVVSEYGIEPVDDAVHINRVLREAGFLRVREEDGLELLDAGASRAFAVADHQIAHVYVRDKEDTERVTAICRATDGVERTLARADQRAVGIDHERAGDLVLIASSRRWFSYYYWLSDTRAPDFARTVDIHRKPGYDPVELFLDPQMSLARPRIAWRLLRKKLGFRQLMDVIPLDASLVRGSHGRVEQQPEHQPVLITQRLSDLPEEVPCMAVHDVILDHLFEAGGFS